MATRDLDLLHPVVRGKCLMLQEACKEAGLEIGVSMTARTEQEQTALWAQGRSGIEEVNQLRAMAGMGAITQEENVEVTWVRISMHQFMLAFDIFLVDKGHAEWSAKADINKNGDPDYNEVGKIGESLGLIWGGRFGDLVHFEWTGGLTLMDLKNGKRPPDTINPQKKTGETS